MKCVAGGLLGFAGIFTLTAAHGLRMHRSVRGFFNRLHGRRVDEEIARLAKLRGDGYITGEEYEAAKKKLLGDL